MENHGDVHDSSCPSRSGRKTDLMVGAQLEGFDRMVDLQAHHKWAVIEGDEYLSSPVDLRPKFLCTDLT